jgi:hypothetical protein
MRLRERARSVGGNEWSALLDATTALIHHIDLYVPLTQIRAFCEKAEQSPEDDWIFEVLFDPALSPMRLERDDPSDACLIVTSTSRVRLKATQTDKWPLRKIISRNTLRKIKEWATNPRDPLATPLPSSPSMGKAQGKKQTIGSAIASKIEGLCRRPQRQKAPIPHIEQR